MINIFLSQMLTFSYYTTFKEYLDTVLVGRPECELNFISTPKVQSWDLNIRCSEWSEKTRGRERIYETGKGWPDLWNRGPNSCLFQYERNALAIRPRDIVSVWKKCPRHLFSPMLSPYIIISLELKLKLTITVHLRQCFKNEQRWLLGKILLP